MAYTKRRTSRKISDIIQFIGKGKRNWEEIYQHMKRRNCTIQQLNQYMRRSQFEIVGYCDKLRFSGSNVQIPVYTCRKLDNHASSGGVI